MGIRPTCPKCRQPAYRTYVQVQHPETKRSTSVAVPAVFCGEPDFKNGHGVIAKTKDHPHGLVMLDAGAFAVSMRQSHALVARIPKGSRKGGRPTGAKPAKPAKKATPKPAQKAAAKPAKPRRVKTATTERADDVAGSE